MRTCRGQGSDFADLAPGWACAHLPSRQRRSCSWGQWGPCGLAGAAHTHTRTHACTHMHAHTHTHTHTHTCIHTDTYTHTHTHRYMHTHTHTHRHTHRHTHIHTHRVKNPYPRQYYGTKYSGRYCLQTKVVKSTSKTTRTCTAVLSNWIIFWGVLRVEGNLYCLLIVGEIALHYIPCHTKLKHFTYNTHTTALKTHLQCSGQT